MCYQLNSKANKLKNEIMFPVLLTVVYVTYDFKNYLTCYVDTGKIRLNTMYF